MSFIWTVHPKLGLYLTPNWRGMGCQGSNHKQHPQNKSDHLRTVHMPSSLRLMVPRSMCGFVQFRILTSHHIKSMQIPSQNCLAFCFVLALPCSVSCCDSTITLALKPSTRVNCKDACASTFSFDQVSIPGQARECGCGLWSCSKDIPITYASWGPIFWPFLRSSARALAVKRHKGNRCN